MRWRVYPWLCLIVLLGGCARLPTDYPRTSSQALEDTDDTTLARMIAPTRDAHPEMAGFYLLSDGIDALAARLLIAARAERSLDAQYYLLHDDITGRLFVRQLLEAADRGVRVRLLLDDIATGDYEAGMVGLDHHPQVEIRLFNPFINRGFRPLDVLTAARRLNHRMHNKSMTVDNQVTVVGGRNIGAEYFGARPDMNFGDLDLLAVGPVVPEVSRSFDEYWNSEYAVPVKVLNPRIDGAMALDNLRQTLSTVNDEARETPYGEVLERTILDAIDGPGEALHWVPYQVVADPPEKASGKLTADNPDTLRSRLGPLMSEAQQELVILSPYFVPRDTGVQVFRQLRARGVRVVILTNSLASNDVPAVHAGYAPYRKALLEAGVELWELRPDVPVERRYTGLPAEGARSSLHAKTFLVDRRYFYVGSLNMDPRSVNINTEMGIVLEAPELAQYVVESIDAGLAGAAYQLQLDEQGRLQWRLQEGDQVVVFDEEPQTSFWQRFSTGLIGLLPIEGQL